ncbi:MAG: hypothetical protein LUM44_13125 [Pyrinomonadaceae bacterium]|nr:hypothetical protein [Pyrinomonadaceae bacterium]
MKQISIIFSIAFLLTTAVFAQKGVDSQTQKIKEEGNKSTSRSNDVTRSFDWGKGKTKVREMLANPYKINSRRDVLVENILFTLREKKILVDEAASRVKDGFIITQPFVFAKGAVITQNELNRYAVIQDPGTVWTRGQFTLTIEVQPIDGIQNNINVTAKVEGRAGNGLVAEWTTLQSSGAAEDEFLSKLVELVTGNSPDAPQDVEQPLNKK